MGRSVAEEEGADAVLSLVAENHDYDHISLWSLVLASSAINHTIARVDGKWQILVAAAQADRARQQIICYEQENRHWPAPPAATSPAEYTPPTVALMGLFVLFFAETGPWRATNSWFAAGSLERQAVLVQQQWWRTVTALTLHADIAHLAGNMIIGGIIIHFLTKSIGAGCGWFLLLLTGAVANGINLVGHRYAHESVGFSTAVFAAIGMLTAMELTSRHGRRARLLALGSGAALVSLFSSGEAHVDVGAHLWGGVCGLMVGVLLGLWRRRGHSFPAAGLQAVFLLLTFIFVGVNWWAALNLP